MSERADRNVTIDQIEKLRRNFFILSTLLVLVIVGFSVWSEDNAKLILLKAAFAPIFILTIQAHNLFWPKSRQDSFFRVVIRQAIGALPIAYFFLVSQINPSRAMGDLFNTFLAFFLVFFLGGVIGELVVGRKKTSKN